MGFEWAAIARPTMHLRSIPLRPARHDAPVGGCRAGRGYWPWDWSCFSGMWDWFADAGRLLPSFGMRRGTQRRFVSAWAMGVVAGSFVPRFGTSLYHFGTIAGRLLLCCGLCSELVSLLLSINIPAW